MSHDEDQDSGWWILAPLRTEEILALILLLIIVWLAGAI